MKKILLHKYRPAGHQMRKEHPGLARLFRGVRHQDLNRTPIPTLLGYLTFVLDDAVPPGCQERLGQIENIPSFKGGTPLLNRCRRLVFRPP